jgi:hypothetical protein
MQDIRNQAVTGIVPPQVGEAKIRDVWPSVMASPLPGAIKRFLKFTIILTPLAWLLPGAATMATWGRILTRSIVLAPLAWVFLLAPLYFGKLLPFLAMRYTLTNRRLMIRRGLRPTASQEVPLAEIDDVRIIKDANSDFYRAATLEVVSHGKVILTLPGVPEPESFRHNIISACKAWVPGKASGPIVPAKAP